VRVPSEPARGYEKIDPVMANPVGPGLKGIGSIKGRARCPARLPPSQSSRVMPERTSQNELIAAAFPRLVNIAVRWTARNHADAEDLAQRALTDAWAAHSGPPFTDVAELVRRAASIMKGLFLNGRRAQKRRDDPQWLPAAAEMSRGLHRSPEAIVATRQVKALLLERLMKRLEDDPLARSLVKATCGGFDTPADQAQALGVDIAEIRKARKRLARAVEAVAATAGLTQRALDGAGGEHVGQTEGYGEWAGAGEAADDETGPIG